MKRNWEDLVMDDDLEILAVLEREIEFDLDRGPEEGLGGLEGGFDDMVAGKEPKVLRTPHKTSQDARILPDSALESSLSPGPGH